MEPCRLDSCVHFNEKARLNCAHEEYGPQDLRPLNPSDCGGFKPKLELVLRSGVYFIRNQVTGIEVEYDRTANAFSDEGVKKLDLMAQKLQVRRKDVFAVSLAIPEEKEEPKVEKKEGKRQSQADMLVTLALAKAVDLFHDDRQVPYIRVQKSDALAALRLRSKEVKSWLAGLLWEAYEKAPNQEALGSALNVLDALGQEGSEFKLYNRVAPGENGSIWLDLADDKWRAVHITKDGWKIIDNPPILFRRYSHEKPIAVPTTSGDIRLLFKYANIRYLGDQLLYLVATISYLIPAIPHVIMVFFGPQGSGKTWSLRVVRILVDPSLLDLLSLPRREREVIQNLDHHWCSFYDNVGRIPTWCSNVFCRAITGTGVSKRALYTDDDDVIYNYHRCVGLTDINIAAERGDMLQRSLLLGLSAIPKSSRKTEKQLRSSFEKDRRSILGAMLDVLVRAIRIYPTIKLEGLNRMADYVVWGCAITEVLGIDRKYFLEAYEENISAQNLEVVRASPISDVLVKLMEANPLAGWEGTPSQLYSELEEKAKEMKISTRQKAWPKKPHVLTRRLNELAPSLPSIGYQIETSRSGKSRLIRISSVTSVTSVTRKEDWGKGKDLRAYLSDASDANDSTFESLTDVQEVVELDSEKRAISTRQGIQNVLSIIALDPVTEGSCPICKKTDVNLVWQVLMMDGTRYDAVCMDCGTFLQEELRERDQA